MTKNTDCDGRSFHPPRLRIWWERYFRFRSQTILFTDHDTLIWELETVLYRRSNGSQSWVVCRDKPMVLRSPLRLSIPANPSRFRHRGKVTFPYPRQWPS
ncbi:hypothetical protein BDV12DRAFT_172740 [Aspergillus spectabilis]